jgi:hypothetical protein
MRKTVLLTLAAAALLAVGCGDDSDSDSSDEARAAAASVTPAEAIGEIAEVRTGLVQGLAAYRQGDADRADELVGDAYLEHFELVEGPLEERDEELNEELEELIRETLRGRIQAEAPVAAVAGLVAEAERGLDRAELALEAK